MILIAWPFYAKTELLEQIEKLKAFTEAEALPISEFEVPPMVARWDRVWRAHQHNTDDDEDSAEDSEGDKAVSITSEAEDSMDADVVPDVDAEPGGDDQEPDESVSDELDSVDEVSEDTPES